MRKSLMLVLLVLLFMVGCAHPPTDEITVATAAYVDLVNHKGDTPPVQAVGDSLESVMKELKWQQQKFALFRSYKKTKDMLTNVIEMAKKVKFSTKLEKPTDIKMTKIMAINAIVDAAISAINKVSDE
jgi:PBP1b-binding outer membrane lipoprotein LpoB